MNEYDDGNICEISATVQNFWEQEHVDDERYEAERAEYISQTPTP